MGPEPELVLSGGQWTDVNCSIVSYCQAQSGSISNLNSKIEPDIKVCNWLARQPTNHPLSKYYSSYYATLTEHMTAKC